MPRKILFVCLGNICRSPTAEGVFRGLAVQAGVDVVVDSAGTSGWHDGNQPDRRSMAEAARRGYDLSDQRSRKLRTSDFHDFDLIVGMDESNITNIRNVAPLNSTAKVLRLLDFAPDQPIRNVPDPYYENDFEGVFDLIEEASRGILREISS